MPKHAQLCLIIVLSIFIHNKHAAASELDCGIVNVADGLTWDYFDPENHKGTYSVPQGHVKLVTNVHLVPKMDSLETGNTGGGIPGFLSDIDYTLRRIPNHPRALDMITRFQLRHDGKILQLRQWAGTWTRSVDCYFDRAFRLTPNNPVIHMLYGIYLHRTGKLTEAKYEYQMSEAFQPDSVELHYNMGLLNFELKDYDLSAEYAKKAYDGGYPLPGLRDKLISVDKWPKQN